MCVSLYFTGYLHIIMIISFPDIDHDRNDVEIFLYALGLVYFEDFGRLCGYRIPSSLCRGGTFWYFLCPYLVYFLPKET